MECGDQENYDKTKGYNVNFMAKSMLSITLDEDNFIQKIKIFGQWDLELYNLCKLRCCIRDYYDFSWPYTCRILNEGENFIYLCYHSPVCSMLPYAPWGMLTVHSPENHLPCPPGNFP